MSFKEFFKITKGKIIGLIIYFVLTAILAFFQAYGDFIGLMDLIVTALLIPWNLTLIMPWRILRDIPGIQIIFWAVYLIITYVIASAIEYLVSKDKK